MKIKKIFQAPIKSYQYISRILPGSCRYYPTCSEYAMWQFEFNTPHKALLSSSLRILRCNQFFEGGIDYPVIYLSPNKSSLLCNPNRLYGKIRIVYWLIPKSSNKYYILKDLDETYLTIPS